MLKILFAVLIGGAIGSVMGYYGKCSTGACPLTATPLRGGIYGACIGVLFAIISAGAGMKADTVPPEVQKAGHELVVVIESDEQFKAEVLGAESPVLVDMYADWCGPCKALAPTIDKLALDFKGKAVVAKLNIDDVTGPPKQYGVTGIPAVFIFYKGEVKAQLTGIQSAASYTEELNSILKEEDK